MNPVRENIGAWCNGNTWVSKTFVVSSNLTAPAIHLLYDLRQSGRTFLLRLTNDAPHFFKCVSVKMNVGVVSNAHIGMSEKF